MHKAHTSAYETQGLELACAKPAAGGITPWKSPVTIAAASEQCWPILGGLTEAERQCWNFPLVLFLGAKLPHQCPALFSLAPFGLVLDPEVLQSLHQHLLSLSCWQMCLAFSFLLPWFAVLSLCYSPQLFHSLILALERGQQCWGGLLPGQREAGDRHPRRPIVLHALFSFSLCSLVTLSRLWKTEQQSPVAALAVILFGDSGTPCS